MTRLTWHKIHKWIWIFTGIFLLGWLISGILMLMPQRFVGANPQVPPISVDYEQTTLTPKQAIDIARRVSKKPAPVKRFNFRPIHDRLVYAVKLENAPELIIDAASGELFSMSPDFAKEIVIFNFPEASRPLSATKLDKHSVTYPYGGLPAYKVTSENEPSTSYFVDSNSERIYRSTTFTRIRSALISLHDFSTLKLIIESDRVRKSLLLIASIAALLGAVIGYYMALPKKGRA